jgi:hypothetical protein
MPVPRLIAASVLAAARLARRRWLALALGTAIVTVGCSSLETQQRKWIFRAQATAAGSEAELADHARRVGMEGAWITHRSAVAGRDIRLRALWAENDDDAAPVMLYLHGARWDLTMGTFRVDRMRDMGFSVLAIDYRGFGHSTDELPSEKGVLETPRPRGTGSPPATRTARSTSTATPWAAPLRFSSRPDWPTRSATRPSAA